MKKKIIEKFKYSNTPFWKGGKVIQIKKKCLKMPMCNQGVSYKANYAQTDAINNPIYSVEIGDDFLKTLSEYNSRKDEEFNFLGFSFDINLAVKFLKTAKIKRINTYNPSEKTLTRIYPEVLDQYSDKKIDFNEPQGIMIQFNYKNNPFSAPIDGNHRIYKAWKYGLKEIKVYVINDIDVVKEIMHNTPKRILKNITKYDLQENIFNGKDFITALMEGNMKYINLLSKPLYSGEAYRTETDFSPGNSKTAGDIVRFEQNELHNKLGVNDATIQELDNFSWREIFWVCPTMECAKHYAVEDLEDSELDDSEISYNWRENVSKLELPSHTRLIAGEPQDGYLVFIGDLREKVGENITKSNNILYRAMDSKGKGGFPGLHFATEPELAGYYGKKINKFSLAPDARLVNITSPEAKELLNAWGLLSKRGLRRKARKMNVDGIIYDHNDSDGICIFNTRKVTALA